MSYILTKEEVEKALEELKKLGKAFTIDIMFIVRAKSRKQAIEKLNQTLPHHTDELWWMSLSKGIKTLFNDKGSLQLAYRKRKK